MALFELPMIPGTSDQSSIVQLEGKSYTIRWRWNNRGAFWALDVRTDSGGPIALGIPARTGARLFGSHRSAELPPGELIMVCVGGDDSDPTLDSVGTLHKPIYADSSEDLGR